VFKSPRHRQVACFSLYPNLFDMIKNISIYDLVSLFVALFVISLWGLFVIRKNLIVVIIALELLALSVSLPFAFFSYYLDDIVGQVFSLFIIAVVGAESAIGLAIVLSYYRLQADISLDLIAELKG